jgi:hypothetical protein
MNMRSEPSHVNHYEKKGNIIEKMEVKMIRLKNMNRLKPERKETERG